MSTDPNKNNVIPSQEDYLKLCYATFGVDSIEEGNQKSVTFFKEQCEKKLDEYANDDNFDNIEKKLKAALQKIEEEKSYAKRAAHFFLNLTPKQQRWSILLTALWISFAMLCVFFGIAIKVDCDNQCQRDLICDLLPANRTKLDCTRSCSLENWSKSLFGIFLLDALLGLVCLIILIITFAEYTNVCGEGKCNHRHTFKMPARIAIFLACACCLIGSLFGVLKLSAEAGGIGPAFLINWKWGYIYAWGYVSYAIVWGAYLLQLYVTDFAATADRNALPDSLRYLGGIVGFVSSLCPLIFFILVGINVDRPSGDKLGGFKLVSPLLAFFLLRFISALIVPFSNCFHHKWEHEAKTIVMKAAAMIGLYSLGFIGFILSALTVNADNNTPCTETVRWKWIYAVIPLVAFVVLMMGWSLGIMILLFVNEENGIYYYNQTTIAIVDLLQHQQVGGAVEGNENSATNLNRKSSVKKEDSFTKSTPLIDKVEYSAPNSEQNSTNLLSYQAADNADHI